MSEDETAAHAVDAAVGVHKALGPGLLESAYVAALQIEFAERGMICEREVPIQAFYRGKPLGVVYRADLLVDGRVLVEVKSVLGLEPSPHSAIAFVFAARKLAAGPATELQLTIDEEWNPTHREQPLKTFHLGAFAPWR